MKPGSPIFTVSFNALRAVRHFCSRDESRFALMHLLIELNPEYVTAVAMDGRRLGAHRGKRDTSRYEIPSGRHLITPWWLDAIDPPAGANGHIAIAIDGDEFQAFGRGGKQVGGRVEVEPDEYPNWRRAMPLGPFSAIGQIAIDHELFNGFYQAAAELGGGGVQLCAHGKDTSPISVFIEDVPEFYGAIMQRRTENRPEIPKWCFQPVGATEDKP